MGLPKQIIGLITPRDAVQLAASCREAAEGVSNFNAAIAFALTRPGLDAKHSLLDVDRWNAIWESCAKSLDSCGLNPSLFAHSEAVEAVFRCYFFEYDRVGHELHDKPCPKAFKDFHFLAKVLKGPQSSVAANVDISAILMVDAYAGYWGAYQSEYCLLGENSGVSLVLLSDGQFAFIFWRDLKRRDLNVRPVAAVYIAKAIPDLLCLVSASMVAAGWDGGDCRWVEDASSGNLTLSCAHDVIGSPCVELADDVWIVVSDLEDEDGLRVDRLSRVLEGYWNQMVQAGGGSSQSQTQLLELTMEPVIQSIVHDEPPMD